LRQSRPVCQDGGKSAHNQKWFGCQSFSYLLLVRHEVAILTVILRFREITLRSAVSTLPRHAPPPAAGIDRQLCM
jgi:hypothetical protein